MIHHSKFDCIMFISQITATILPNLKEILCCTFNLYLFNIGLNHKISEEINSFFFIIIYKYKEIQ